ncbi:hypothetical protein KIPB_000498 [Kipferlia bialata]|uniref:Uncharacterized protein n=1 Tax=Kipferlia bialata TaxID=797122 RepID=A0A9K3GDI5_9EUKA|nr:hypothetical protein KIPB_000498 [Kipferlia bialata]|eukprot:g498.t1
MHKSLRELDISFNPLSSVNELAKLRNLGNLGALSVMGCPVAEVGHYRSCTVYFLPQLSSLDSAPVSQEERVIASDRFSRLALDAALADADAGRARIVELQEEMGSVVDREGGLREDLGRAQAEIASLRHLIEAATKRDGVQRQLIQDRNSQLARMSGHATAQMDGGFHSVSLAMSATPQASQQPVDGERERETVQEERQPLSPFSTASLDHSPQTQGGIEGIEGMGIQDTDYAAEVARLTQALRDAETRERQGGERTRQAMKRAEYLSYQVQELTSRVTAAEAKNGAEGDRGAVERDWAQKLDVAHHRAQSAERRAAEAEALVAEAEQRERESLEREREREGRDGDIGMALREAERERDSAVRERDEAEAEKAESEASTSTELHALSLKAETAERERDTALDSLRDVREQVEAAQAECDRLRAVQATYSPPAVHYTPSKAARPDLSALVSAVRDLSTSLGVRMERGTASADTQSLVDTLSQCTSEARRQRRQGERERQRQARSPSSTDSEASDCIARIRGALFMGGLDMPADSDPAEVVEQILAERDTLSLRLRTAQAELDAQAAYMADQSDSDTDTEGDGLGGRGERERALAAQLSQAEDRCTSLSAELKERERAMAALTARQTQTLEGHRSDLRAARSQATEAREEAATASASVASLTDQCSALQTQLDAERERCHAAEESLQEALATPSVTTTTEPGEVDALREQVVALQADLEQAERDAQAARDEAAAATLSMSTMASGMATDTQLQEQQRQLEDLTEQLEESEGTRRHLTATLSAERDRERETAQKHAEEVASLTAEVDTLREEASTLRGQLEEARTPETHTPTPPPSPLSVTVDKIETMLGQAGMGAEGERPSSPQALEFRLSVLIAERDRLREDLQTALSTHTQPAFGFVERVQGGEGDATPTAAEALALTSRVHQLEESVATLQAERDALSGVATSLVAQRDALRQESQTRVEALEAEADSLAEERDRLQSETTRLEGQVESLATERDTISSDRDSLSSERDRLLSERDLLAAKADRADVLEAECAKVSEERDSLSLERDTLLGQITSLEAEGERLTAECETLREAAAESDTVAEGAEDSTIPSLTATDATALEDMTLMRDTALGERDTALEERDAAVGERDSALEEVDRLSQVVTDTQIQLDEASARVSTLEGTVATLVAEADGRRGELAGLEAHVTMDQEAMHAAEERERVLTQERDAARTDLSQAMEREGRLQATVAEKEARIAELATSLRIVQEDNDTINPEYAMLRERYYEQADTLAQTQREAATALGEATAKSASLTEERDALLAGVSEAQTALAAEREQLGRAQERVASLQAKVEQGEEALSTAEAEVRVLRERERELQEERDALQVSLTQTQARLSEVEEAQTLTLEELTPSPSPFQVTETVRATAELCGALGVEAPADGSLEGVASALMACTHKASRAAPASPDSDALARIRGALAIAGMVSEGVGAEQAVEQMLVERDAQALRLRTLERELEMQQTFIASIGPDQEAARERDEEAEEDASVVEELRDNLDAALQREERAEAELEDATEALSRQKEEARERETALSEEIAAARSQIESLQTQLDTVRGDAVRAALESGSQSPSSSSDASDLADRAETAERQVASLLVQLSSARNSLQEAQARSTGLTQEVEALELVASRVRQEESQLGTALGQSVSERESLSKRTESLSMERDALMAERDSLALELVSAKRQTDTLQKKLESLSTTHATLQTQLAEREREMSAQLAYAEAARDRVTAERDALDAEKAGVLEPVQEMQSMIRTLTARVQEADTLRSESEAKVTEAEERERESEAKVAELDAERITLLATVADVEERERETEARVGQAVSALAAADARSAHLTQDLASCRARLSEAEARVAEAVSELGMATEREGAMEAMIEEEQGNTAAALKRAQAAEAKVGALERQAKQGVATASEVETSLRSELSSMQGALETERVAAEKSAVQAARNLEEAERQRVALEERVSGLTARLAFEAEEAAQRETVSAATLRACREEVASCRATLSEVTDQLHTARQELSVARESEVSLQQRLTASEEKVTGAASVLSESGERLVALDTQCRTLTGRLAEVEGERERDAARSRETMSALRSDVTSLKATLHSVEQARDTAVSELAEAQGYIDTLRDRAEGAETRFGQVQGQLLGEVKRASDAQNQVLAANKRCAALETQLESAQQAVAAAGARHSEAMSEAMEQVQQETTFQVGQAQMREKAAEGRAKEAQARLGEAVSRVSSLQASLAESGSALDETKAELGRAQAQRLGMQEEQTQSVREAERERDTARRERDEAQQEMARTEADLTAKLQAMSMRIEAAETLRDTSSVGAGRGLTMGNLMDGSSRVSDATLSTDEVSEVLRLTGELCQSMGVDVPPSSSVETGQSTVAQGDTQGQAERERRHLQEVAEALVACRRRSDSLSLSRQNGIPFITKGPLSPLPGGSSSPPKPLSPHQAEALARICGALHAAGLDKGMDATDTGVSSLTVADRVTDVLTDRYHLGLRLEAERAAQDARPHTPVSSGRVHVSPSLSPKEDGERGRERERETAGEHSGSWHTPHSGRYGREGSPAGPSPAEGPRMSDRYGSSGAVRPSQLGSGLESLGTLPSWVRHMVVRVDALVKEEGPGLEVVVLSKKQYRSLKDSAITQLYDQAREFHGMVTSPDVVVPSARASRVSQSSGRLYAGSRRHLGDTPSSASLGARARSRGRAGDTRRPSGVSPSPT